jgi:hypothetical protein
MRISQRARRGAAACLVVACAATGAISYAVAKQPAAHPSVPRWGASGGTPDPGVAAASAAAGSAIKVLEDERHQQFVFVDTPPKRRENPGDSFVFEEPLLNAGGTSTVGMLDETCVEGFSMRSLCTATAQLDGRGKIVFGGTSNLGPFLLAIHGGTSEFSGVRGQVLVQNDQHADTSAITFLLK